MSDIRINVDAEDSSAGTLNQAAQNIERVGQSAQRATGGLQSFADSAAHGAREVEHAMSMLTRLDLVQITLEQSSDRVANAQERYNEALAKYGAESSQAKAASQELERAQANLEKANLRAELSIGLVATQSLQMAVGAIPQLRNALAALTASTTTAAAASATLNIAMTAGVAAISITAGILAVKTAMDGLTSSTDGATNSLQAFSQAGADARLEATKQRIAAIKEEVGKLEEKIAFKGWEDWPNWGDNPKNREKLEALYQEMSDLSGGLTALEGSAGRSHQDMMDDWIAAEKQRSTETTGSLAEVEASMQHYQQVAEAARATLASPVDASTRAEAGAALTDAMEHLDDLGDRHKEIVESAEAEANHLAQTWGSALQGIGVNFSNMTREGIAAVAALGGGLGAFAEKALLARDAEMDLAKQAVSAGGALFDQLTITNKKGQTTEELAASLGITAEQEASLRAEGRWTTEGLISQTEAAKRLTDANAQVASSISGDPGGFSGGAGSSGGSGGGGSILPGWKGSAMGGWQRTAGAAVDMSSTDGGNWTRSIQQLSGNGSRNAMSLLDQMDAMVKANPGLAANPDFQMAMMRANMLARNQYAGGSGIAPALAMNLARMGVRFAADGFEGRVNGPTLFMAGEAGPEQVSIRPGAGGASGGGGLVLNGGIQVSVQGQANAAAVSRGVVDGLSIVAKRAASRRAY